MKCSAKLMTKECVDYNVRHGKEPVCGCNAKYLVDEVPLCARHAGVAVLQIGSNRVQSLGSDQFLRKNS